MGSEANLFPNKISLDSIVVFGVSKFISSKDCKLIVLEEFNNIESFLELNNNLPEFKII